MLTPLAARRFHDSRGNWINGGGLVYAPRALFSAGLRVVFGYRPDLPWLSYRAIRELSQLIQPHWKILEFGSGMSTIWFARRCAFLHTIESDPDWYQEVSSRLAHEHLTHVHCELREPAKYADVRKYPSGFFDLVLVDGLVRDECVRQALAKIRAGGWIYIDNVDRALEPGGDMRVAEELLAQALEERQGSKRYFVDFAPSQFFVNQGVLAQLQAPPSAMRGRS